MSVPVDVVSTFPAAVVVTFLILRWGATAALTLLAGIVAVMARDHERGERALKVLRLLRRSSAGSTRRQVTRN